MAEIIWSKQAREDLRAIYDYISKDSSLYAFSLVRKIVHAVEKLVSFPKLGRLVPKYERQKLREIIFQNYRIIYKIQRRKITIYTVVHTSRNINGLQIDIW